MSEEPVIKYEKFSDGCRISISGAGGGKSKSKGGKGSKNSIQSAPAQPTEAKVSLRSRAYVTVLAAICEGEIASFPKEALECIFLDETPIRNQDGSINFTDIILDYRNGNQHQGYIPMTGGVETENEVSIKVTRANGPVVRTLSNPNANNVKVRLMTPGLREVDQKNNILGSVVAFRIDLSTQAGPYQTVIEDKIEGYTTGSYERAYSIGLTTGGPWNIRITRLTPDATTTAISNDLYWQAFTSVVHNKFRYPNTALLAFRVSAEQFRSIPQLSIDLLLLNVRLPHNYNPTAKTYSGIFNGSLTNYGSSNNPVWIYYDLMTNPRYGLGELIDTSAIDVFALYSIAQYCDESVPNGRGGFEARFECNVFIQSQEDAFKVIDALVSVFRSIAYYAAGTVTLVQDRPRLPVRIYTESNVVQEVSEDGKVTAAPFNYAGVARSAIHTVAQVSYSNRENFYRQEIEVVDDPESRRRYGYNPIEVTAFGCVTRSQARRVGEWLLATERLRTETITFKVGSEGLLVRPGEVFRVADTLRQGQRRGGRVIASTPNSITIEFGVSLEGSGAKTELYIVDANGTTIQRTLNNAPGGATVLTFSNPIQPPPPVNTIWVIESPALESQLFQCVKVVEQELNTYEITGTTYAPGIHEYIDRDQPLPVRSISTLPDPRLPPPPPGALEATELLISTIGSGGIKSRIDLTWQSSPNVYVDRYRLRLKLASDYTFQTISDVTDTRHSLYDLAPGIYDLQVSALNRTGIESSPVTTRFEVRGLTYPPAEVTNFSVVPVGYTAILSWDLHPDLDVRVGGNLSIKYTPKTENATWADGFDLTLVPGNSTTVSVPLLNGTYLIKAVDSSGSQSNNPKIVVVENYVDIVNRNLVAETCEHPLFLGAKKDTVATGMALKLATLDMMDYTAGLWDAFPGNVDQAGNYFDSLPGLFNSMSGSFDLQGTAYSIIPVGTYDFAAPIDLGAVFTARITADAQAFKVNEYEYFDANAAEFDQTIGWFDGQDPDSSRATMLVAISQDGINYNDYQHFITGDYTGRAFKFRLVLESGASFHNVQVNKLCVTVDAPDRIETGNLTTGSTATTISFSQPYYVVPIVGVAIQNGTTGDYVQLGTITKTGFTVTTRNSSNAIAPKNISWYARGY